MRTKIYYFSGTGNSLAVASAIAAKVNAVLISIPTALNSDKLKIDAEQIGIIFPSYLAPLVGVPLIVDRFVKKIINIQSLQIFAVCTCGGYESVNALRPLKKLRQLIRSSGGNLSSEYSVRLPMNNLDYDHIPVPIVRDQKVIISRSKKRIDDICDRVINNRSTTYRFAKSVFMILMEPLYKLIQKPVINTLKEKAKEAKETKLKYSELIPLTDKSIAVSDSCIGCGTCAKVCPVKNIIIVNTKPKFQHHCEMCFSCDEWCPSGAIQHWSRAKGVKYHYPEVKIADMMK